ncbi:hypothetical protein [Leptothermofonsia sp. ETS-13]|uniref:hypothetical protein n=1 Tax=Leptothermofonsia sp. ETS-13 TaxID=3035696 RepID=UPI003BA247CE
MALDQSSPIQQVQVSTDGGKPGKQQSKIIPIPPMSGHSGGTCGNPISQENTQYWPAPSLPGRCNHWMTQMAEMVVLEC